MAHGLRVEKSDESFARRGATKCVVIPRPPSTRFEDVLSMARNRAIISQTEAIDFGSVLVRIGEGPQEVVTTAELISRLGTQFVAVG